ncbi:MAG: UTP--glucose-1-phosphate uridylyltransferase [Pseudomonadota bacterium]
MIKKVVFPVGGLGTRFLPATKSMPKEMLPVNAKPLIQYAFEEAVNAGIEEFIFITGRNKNTISNHFDHAYELQTVLDEQDKDDLLAQAKDWLPEAGSIAFVRQQEPLGLGHAIWCARKFIGQDENFAVILADELILSEEPMLKTMIDLHNEVGGNIIGLSQVNHHDVNRYGIVELNRNTAGSNNINEEQGYYNITKMVEKPAIADAPSDIAMIGRYIINSDIFKYLKNSSATIAGEVQLTDNMQKMLSDGYQFNGLMMQGKRYDCGNRIGFLEANIAYSLADKNQRNEVMTLLNKLITQ